jgi:hypothetical protein
MGEKAIATRRNQNAPNLSVSTACAIAART